MAILAGLIQASTWKKKRLKHACCDGSEWFAMEITDLLAPSAILPTLTPKSKKQVLQTISAKAAEITGLTEREIFDTLLEREKLGSTAMGNGVAIPHGRLNGIDQLFGMFVRLAKGIDFEALDDEPVDLIFVLFAPDGAGADHLKALARVARVLRDTDTTNKLRGMENPEAIYALLSGAQASHAA
jgi:PTS system nitrogen regulatory IIA component